MGLLSDDLLFAYRYPFTREAGEAVKSSDFSLDSVPSERFQAGLSIASSLAQGKDFRLAQAADSEGVKAFLADFVLARIIVALADNESLKRSFARKYADFSYHHLVAEDSKSLFDFFINTLGFNADLDKGFVKVALEDYLRFPLSDESLKLVNRRVGKGFVYLLEEDARLFLKNAFYWNYYNAFNEKDYSQAPKEFIEAGKKVKEVLFSSMPTMPGFEGAGFGKVDPTSFPPCIRLLYQSLNAGQLPPHYANVAFATFMLNIGASKEQVQELYRKTPKYDEKIVDYQLGYLQGKHGSGKAYRMPSCKKMQSWDVCPLAQREDLCFKITNPVTFYAKRVKGAK